MSAFNEICKTMGWEVVETTSDLDEKETALVRRTGSKFESTSGKTYRYMDFPQIKIEGKLYASCVWRFKDAEPTKMKYSGLNDERRMVTFQAY